MNTARIGIVRDVGQDGILRAGRIHFRRSRPTLERELRDLLGSGRNAGIAARYYGFDGRGGGSLQTVGNEIGVTRERIRQIVAAVSERLCTGRPVSPALDRTIAFVVDRMPANAGEIEAELRSQRLTASVFRLEGVIKAAEVLARRVPFSITEVKGERLVHAWGIPPVDAIVRIARRIVSRRGMATIPNVVAIVRMIEPGVCGRNLVVSALACLRGFRWLDQSAGWFWLSNNPNNPVLNRIRKILSIANPIDISELRAGISRDYTMGGVSPPKRILLEFCRQVPGLCVNDQTVTAEPAVNSGDVLSPVERDIVHILSEHGGAMATSEFKSVCLGMGVHGRTLYQNLLRSPIISKHAAGRYGLIGSGERSGSGARISRESVDGTECVNGSG